MAFDPTPTTWLASWSEDGTTISVPIATFPELTAVEADAATGDIRKIAWALMEKLYATYNATAIADRPTKWTMSKSSSINTTTGIVTNTFVTTVLTEIATQEVPAE